MQRETISTDKGEWRLNKTSITPSIYPHPPFPLQRNELTFWKYWICRTTWRACPWRRDCASAEMDKRRRTCHSRSTGRFSWVHPPNSCFPVRLSRDVADNSAGVCRWPSLWLCLALLFFALHHSSRFTLPNKFLSDDDSSGHEGCSGLPPFPVWLSGTSYTLNSSMHPLYKDTFSLLKSD